MKTAMLHELIKMANEGFKFEARIGPYNQWASEGHFKCDQFTTFSAQSIITPWELKETPQAVEFELDCKKKVPYQAICDVLTGPSIDQYNFLCRKKWKVTCTEILEE